MDIIVRLESDHRCFLMASGRMLGMSDGDPAALETLRRLKAGLTRHEQMECSLLHPLLRSHNPDCSAVLEDSEREHRRLERVMDEALSELAGGTQPPALRRSLGEFDRLLRSHLFHEEETVFLLAERGVPASELMRLGEQAELLASRQ